MNEPNKKIEARAHLSALSRPRFWLILWGALGALFVVYVMATSAVQTSTRPGAGETSSGDRVVQDPKLLTGDMAKFSYAFSARTTPNVVFNDDETGAPTRLQDYRGKTILVNFWATWCAPCKKELPSLDLLQAELGGDGFEVVAVAADPKGREAADRLFSDLGITHLNLLLDHRLTLASATGGSTVLPLSILYDQEGREVGRLVGEANWASPEAKALIRRVVAQR